MSVPDRRPVPLGVKVTATAVLLPPLTVKEEGENVNWPSLDEMPVTERSALPELDTVND